MDRDIILDVKGLKTSFYGNEGEIRAVDGVSFTLERGKTLGIVGESGSGKSVTALSILGLLERTTGKVIAGEVWFKGVDILKNTKKEMRNIRGSGIAMIFQESMTSLNPTMTCGEQIAEMIRFRQKVEYQKTNGKEAWKKAVEMLDLFGIPEPEKMAKCYPFELSGGMHQRVMIGISLACNPELLIADEPTTSLDLITQAQILEVIKSWQREKGTSLIINTHDFGVIAEMCDDVAVMHEGKIVEVADVDTLFNQPKHWKTIELLNNRL